MAFKASPSSQHQHCTDEAQKAETVLSAVIAGPKEARNPNLDSDQRISYYACVPCL